MDLIIMHVFQKGVKPVDHSPPHTVPHYYFLFLSGDYKSLLTQCIPQLLLSRWSARQLGLMLIRRD